MDLMRTPKSLDLTITNRCNLRCLYCSYFSSAADVENDLPVTEWTQFFEELNRCAVMDVSLGGGEPFLRKDLKDLIESIVDNRLRYSILTNGTLITREMATYIAETKRCNSVQVSIDGSTAEVHDLCRGEGNFEKAVRGARHLIDAGVKTTVRVTIHKNNVGDLDNITRFLLEDMKLPSFSTNSANHMGLCRQNAGIVQLGVEDRIRAMESLVELNRKYGNRISAQAGPLAEAKHWTMMVEARKAGKESLANFGFLTACNGPAKKLAVRPDGIIVPCGQLSHIELGRINRDSLTDVWQNHPELKRLRERSKISLDQFEFCKGCEYMMYCTGGCPATAYTFFGKDQHPSPESCFRQFLMKGGYLPKTVLTGNSSPGGETTYG